MNDGKQEKRQLGVLIDKDLMRQLRLEAVELDMRLSDYVRLILRNRDPKKIKMKKEK